MAKRSLLFSNEHSYTKGLSLTFLSFRADELYNELKKGRQPDDAYDKYTYAKVYRFENEILFMIIESRSTRCKARRGMSIKCKDLDSAEIEMGFWIDFLWNYKQNTKQANIANRREMAKVVEAMLISRGFQVSSKSKKSEADTNSVVYKEAFFTRN